MNELQATAEFMKVEYRLSLSQQSVRLLEETRAHGDLQKILWELRQQMRLIDSFVCTEAHYFCDPVDRRILEKMYMDSEEQLYHLSSR